MHEDKKKIIFEGAIYRKLIKKIKSDKIYYKKLELNKTWIADLVPNYINKEQSGTVFQFKVILKLLIKIFFIEYKLKKIYKGKNKIWFIISPSIRKIYKELLASVMKSNHKPTIVTWDKIFKINNLKKIFDHFFLCYQIIKKLNKITHDKKVIFETLYNSLISVDLYDSLSKEIPEVIFSFKDFQRHENAVIQKANHIGVKTFTTQHAVHPDFICKNERIGNIVFSNCESKNILLWGNFCKKFYKKYQKDKSFMQSRNYFLPKKIKKNYLKTILLICLGSDRHINESIDMLEFIKKNQTYIKKKFKIVIKLHPTISECKFNKFFKRYLDGMKYQIHNSSLNPGYVVNKNSIVITGLSGSYYDALYLGIKTFFFDHNFSLSNKMPRVFENLNKFSNLKNILENKKKINDAELKIKANKILKKVWGIKVNGNYNDLVEEILN